ncbi:Putative G-protein coupled receptor [Sarcoptes scabiei]|uniref:Putative G-protein coupled receptor n=1 Tax=Sarcoptes scabiei TaxID=52283 RepID=A0A834RIN1_SARSC|nr:Putative G-protein coupled receptor [Sarcoptes scabiei]
MDFVRCNNSGINVHRSLWCDGRPDCPVNHEDELNCKSECDSNELRCSNSRCIALGNRCDTICDCAGTCEDEIACDQFYKIIDGVKYCSPTQTISCSLSDDGRYVDRCLNKEYVCNGHSDCPKVFDDEYGCLHDGEEKNSLQSYTKESCSTLIDHFWCPIENRCLPSSVRCNFIQECFDGFDEQNCETKQCTEDEFRCLNNQCVPKHQRCNSKFDCFDKSDEIDCNQNFHCPKGTRRCRSGQCIPNEWWCDYFIDCIDESDELDCLDRQRDFVEKKSNITKIGSIFEIGGQKSIIKSESRCDTNTQFQCDNGQCIPIQFRCLLTNNSRSICADRSNLNGCGNFSCQPYADAIKCAGSFCVDQTLKCNERLDCPVLSDWADEQLCPFFCSENRQCPCIDTTINCSDQALSKIPEHIEDQILRMILKGNQLGLNLTLNMFNKLDRMHMIDLSENQIQFIPPGLFRKLWKLRILSLNGNQIRSIREHAFSGLTSLKTLDLSNQRIISLQKNSFNGLRSLKNLDLSNNLLLELYDGVFSGLSNVISIDLHLNKIKNIGSKTFQGLNSLKQINFDEFRFCCLTKFVENCYPPPNEFSSCEDLMSNTILRICIWCLGSIALIGNLFVIMWRLKYQTINRVHSFLIINLALGDLLMGIYLLIIASVDSYYRGLYFIADAYWRQSSLCHFAGFLSTLSSEISVFFLIFITLDRLITITFPFRIYRIHSQQAKWIIVILWTLAILLSGLPLIPIEYFDNFYGRSGVCLALHITHERPNGWEYSVFIFLVLNLISFTFICGSYVWMFFVAKKTQRAASGRCVQSSSSSTIIVATTETRVQKRMAKRMMFIVMTDFFCWMPIISLGIVSLFDVRIPPQIFAWIAVFVLPLNAAINPTLYTLSGLTFSKSCTSISSATTTKSDFCYRKSSPNNNNLRLPMNSSFVPQRTSREVSGSFTSLRKESLAQNHQHYCNNKSFYKDPNLSRQSSNVHIDDNSFEF